MKKNVFGFLFAFIVCGVVSSFTFANVSYSSMMSQLHKAEQKITTSLEEQIKKIDKDMVGVKKGLQEDYPYVALNCLGIVTFDYQPTSGTIKNDLYKKLLTFNDNIYRNKLGMITGSTSIYNKLSQFLSSDITKETNRLWESYTKYKTDFASTIKSYINNNKDLMFPLISKMKELDNFRVVIKDLDNALLSIKNKLFQDSLLGKVEIVRKQMRVVLEKTFDSAMKNRITPENYEHILQMKKEYLADYNHDFDALYAEVIGMKLYSLDTDVFTKFLGTYSSEKTYACDTLLTQPKEFNHLKYLANQSLKDAKGQLATLTIGIQQYFDLSKKDQELRKIKFVKALKNMIDTYRGPKINALIVKLL